MQRDGLHGLALHVHVPHLHGEIVAGDQVAAVPGIPAERYVQCIYTGIIYIKIFIHKLTKHARM